MVHLLNRLKQAVRHQAQDANASTAFQDVEVSSEGSSARTSDVDFALSDFSRVEKGSNRPIEGTYQGYCYLMDAPADSLCLVDLSGVVVVYVPEALAKQNGLDLQTNRPRPSLKLHIQWRSIPMMPKVIPL